MKRAGLAALPLAVVTVFFLWPILGMIDLGLRPHGSFDWRAFVDVVERPRVGRVLWFTIWSATVATVTSLVLGIVVAWALAHLQIPAVRVLRALVLIPFVLPTVVVGVAFRQLLADSGPLGWLGLDGTATAIVIALVYFNFGIVVRAVGAAWQGLDPRPAEAARSLGATPARVWWRITLPALVPGIAAAACVVFLFCATSFGVVLTMGGLRYANLETEIYLLTAHELDLRSAAVLSILQLVTIVALLSLTARLRQPAITARRYQAARPISPGDWPALLVLAAAVLFVLLPVVGLVTESLQAGGGWSLANWRALTAETEVVAALGASLRIAALAALVSVVLGGLVSWVVSRPVESGWPGRIRSAFDSIFMLPLGVSAVTLGFGLLVTMPPDVRTSSLLVPLAQALVALPLVVRTVVPVLASVEPQQRQAAAALGAGPIGTALRVDLRLAAPAIAAATGFAFAVSLGEFGATAFLTRPDATTLPVLIYQLVAHAGAGTQGVAMAASVVLAATCAGVVLLVDRLHTTIL